MKNYFYLATLATFLLLGCTKPNNEKEVTSFKDIRSYIMSYDSMRSQELISVDEQLNFWKGKIEISPNGFVYMQKAAQLYMKRFNLAGDPEDLRTANSYLNKTNSFQRGKGRRQVYHLMAGNYISLHEFKKAEETCMKIFEEGIDDGGTQLMLFDIYMELGNYERAENIIHRFQMGKSNEFDCLVRASKFLDYKGKLDSAILVMHQAEEKVSKFGEKKELQAWVNTMLGEMYGHLGDAKTSYQYFLKALTVVPNYEEALKKIAWMMYSKEDKAEWAYLIIDILYSSKPTPDLLWELAQLTDGINDDLATELYKTYYNQTIEVEFEELYRYKLALLESKLFKDHETAIKLAKEEVLKRPTIQSYDLLAWIYYLKGDYNSSIHVCEQHLEGETSEPLVLYHMGMIYKQNNKHSQSRFYLSEALKSGVELGPTIRKNINQAL